MKRTHCLPWALAVLPLFTASCGDDAAELVPRDSGTTNNDGSFGDAAQNPSSERDAQSSIAEDSAVPTGGPDAATTPQDDAGVGAGVRTYPTDRASFGLGGASRCAQADVLLCEDFEADAIDTGTWNVETWGNGSASIDGSKSARGSRSVHINEPSGVSRVMLRETKTFASTGNHFFGRFFMLMNYAPPPLDCSSGCNNLVHWTAASAGGAYRENDQTYRPDVRAIGAVNQGFLLNLDGGPKAEVGVGDDNPPAGYTGFDASHVNQWMCFEFEYAGEGTAAEVRVWWDGREHPGLHYSTARRGETGELWPIPKYDYLEFGLAHYQDYGSFVSSFDAWIDEIIVDDERVGCSL